MVPLNSETISANVRFLSMSEYARQARAKGWTMKEIAERWGLTQRQLSNIGNAPSQIHWDALAGLPDKNAGA